MEDGSLGGSSLGWGGGGGEEARGCGFTILFIENEFFLRLCVRYLSREVHQKKTSDVRTSPRKFVMF